MSSRLKKQRQQEILDAMDPVTRDREITRRAAQAAAMKKAKPPVKPKMTLAQAWRVMCRDTCFFWNYRETLGERNAKGKLRYHYHMVKITKSADPAIQELQRLWNHAVSLSVAPHPLIESALEHEHQQHVAQEVKKAAEVYAPEHRSAPAAPRYIVVNGVVQMLK